MYCTKCGKPIIEGARYCYNCGVNVEGLRFAEETAGAADEIVDDAKNAMHPEEMNPARENDDKYGANKHTQPEPLRTDRSILLYILLSLRKYSSLQTKNFPIREVFLNT